MKKLLVVCFILSFCLFTACGSAEEINLETSSAVIEQPSPEESSSAEIPLEDIDVDDTAIVDEMNSGEETEAAIEEEIVDPMEDSPIVLMDTVLFAQRDVNVRSGPGTDYDKVGALSVNTEVTVTGQDKESGWYQIEYEDGVAFVSDSYLGEDKVVVSTAPTTSADTPGSSNPPATTSNTTPTPTPPSDNQNTQNNNDSSSDWFTGDDMMNALQWHQGMTP